MKNMKRLTITIFIYAILVLNATSTIGGTAPVLNIKVYGSVNQITLKPSDVLSIELDMEPGNALGTNADWWVVASTPSGSWYSWVYPTGWINIGSDLSQVAVAYQGALFALSPFKILNTSNLAEGDYNLYFGVDTNMNGLLDYSSLSYSSFKLTIASSTPTSTCDLHKPNKFGGDCPESALPKPILTWGSCEEISPTALTGGFVCAKINVPLDYDQPKGRQISLAVVKHEASIPSERVGTVIMNPGGPGGTGTSQIPGWLGLFPKELVDRFDIVSWDPRGIGMSDSVQCFNNAIEEMDFLGESADFPVTWEQQRKSISVFAKFGQRCAQVARGLASHVSTADTARDLEQLRRAVGEPKLRYIGISYGTFLGATYANLFPDKVGTMVLDGNVAPNNWTADRYRHPLQSISMRIGSGAGAGFSMRKFIELCAQVGKEQCKFSGLSLQETQKKWDDLLNRLLLGPITVYVNNNPVVMTYSQLLGALNSMVNFVQPFTSSNPNVKPMKGWPQIAEILEMLWKNLETPPTTVSPPASTTDTPISYEKYAGMEQTLAVMCGDSPNPRNTNYYIRESQNVVERDGPIALTNLWGDEPCATWRIREEDTYAGPWNRPTANSILVVRNTFDPATPYQNSLDMVEQLADARLLTVEGFGHSELLNPSDCANAYIVEYLISGVLPPVGTVCQQNKQPFAPLSP